MFILALKEQTLTYTVVIAVMHVAWILWIIASGREVVHKLENHVYSIYPKKNTLIEIHNIILIDFLKFDIFDFSRFFSIFSFGRKKHIFFGS